MSVVAILATASPDARAATKEGTALRDSLVREAAQPGKPAWLPMLLYLAELHGRSVFPPMDYFPHPFESIGPGYQGGKVFGHIDLTHIRLDTVRALPEHARNQIRNELAGQQPDGLIPGVITFDKAGKAAWKPGKGFPAIWVVSVDAYVEVTADTGFLKECLDALRKQIGWFEKNRAAPGGGFYYLDVIQKTWESGMDEGIRYDQRPPAAAASVDATSHVFMLYEHAARWSRKLGQPHSAWEDKAKALQQFIQTKLWDAQSGFFYDSWIVREPGRRHLAFEGMWPVVTGAASDAQAKRVIEHLLNPKEFFSPHPISTVALNDPKFELRMWRGPVWNCMTYWAARGCLRYGQNDAARKLLEAALDSTAVQFKRTGTIWEFYHPQLGDQKSLYRKPKGRHIPCEDYLGHNPLFAMADLWRKCGGATAK
ncbi:MAG: glycoside hydrolase [Verrucomicrobia bacterium]|nr:glycoside hydrolase [Verrucomicrobiota bacterium]